MVKEWGKVARGMECIVCLMTRYAARSEHSYSHPVRSRSHFTAILPCHNSFPLTMKHNARQTPAWSTKQYTSHVSFVWNFPRQICKNHPSSRPSFHAIPVLTFSMIWYGWETSESFCYHPSQENNLLDVCWLGHQGNKIAANWKNPHLHHPSLEVAGILSHLNKTTLLNEQNALVTEKQSKSLPS